MQLLQAERDLLKGGTLLYLLQPTKLQILPGGEVRGTEGQSKAIGLMGQLTLLPGKNVPEPLVPIHELGLRCSVGAWIFIHSQIKYWGPNSFLFLFCQLPEASCSLATF